MANEETDLSTEIATNAQGFSEARGDSSSMKKHSLPDQIAADKYLRAKSAQASSGLGFVLRRIIPPGTTGLGS